MTMGVEQDERLLRDRVLLLREEFLSACARVQDAVRIAAAAVGTRDGDLAFLEVRRCTEERRRAYTDYESALRALREFTLARMYR